MESASCPEGASAVSAKATKDHIVKQVSVINEPSFFFFLPDLFPFVHTFIFLRKQCHYLSRSFYVWLFLSYVRREQQVFIQRRSPAARWSEEEEQAEEKPPGAPASLQTAPQEACCLITPHTPYKEITHLWTLKNQGCLQGTQWSKGKTNATVSIFQLASQSAFRLYVLYFHCCDCFLLNLSAITVQLSQYHNIMYICVRIF